MWGVGDDHPGAGNCGVGREKFVGQTVRERASPATQQRISFPPHCTVTYVEVESHFKALGGIRKQERHAISILIQAAMNQTWAR